MFDICFLECQKILFFEDNGLKHATYGEDINLRDINLRYLQLEYALHILIPFPLLHQKLTANVYVLNLTLYQNWGYLKKNAFKENQFSKYIFYPGQRKINFLSYFFARKYLINPTLHYSKE